MKADDSIRKFVADSQVIFKFLASHYVVVTSAIFLIFTGGCYLYSSNYYSNFGVEFYYFATLADVYQPAITGGILLSCFIIYALLHTIAIIFIRMYVQGAQCSSRLQTVKSVFICLMCLAAAITVCAYFITNIKGGALDIKEGFVARYTLHTENSIISCLPIIATTNNYILVWDDKLRETHIIYRQRVNQIDLVVEPPPLKFPLPKSRFQPVTKDQVRELSMMQQRWSEKLKNKCNLTVVWPDHKK